MKNILLWLKSNPITVLSIIVVLVSLGAIGYFYQRASAITSDTTLDKALKDISQMRGQNVDLPPEKLGEAIQTISGVTFNEVEYERLSAIFNEMNRRANAAFAQLAEINKQGKTVMLEGVLPEPPPTQTQLAFDAKTRYRSILSLMLGPVDRAVAESRSWGWPSPLPALNAGLPPTEQELTERLKRLVDEAVASFGGTPSAQQQADLDAEQRARLISLLKARARQFNIYANPHIGSDTQLNPAFSLSVMNWAYAPTRPEPYQIWEGQIELWIQQDLVTALAKANRIGGTFTNEQGVEVPASVLYAPVKRLISIDVLPGYVGLHDIGGVGRLDPAETTAGIGPAPLTLQPRTGSTVTTTGILPPSAQPPADASTEQQLNYFFGPSGRLSSAMYLVRHTRMIVHVDYHRVNELFDAIASTNLMTIVDMRVRGINEYNFTSLGGPFLYGQGDIVELDMVIETAWVRSWLEPLMPPRVKEYLGVAPAADAVTMMQ